ncbi:MAG: hypothetical protein JW771_02410 [Candidatus Thermoplasmatota archaeon]|nr:hypothetical protein [Candidatus Thermoplasmatota archaeon]
MNRSNIVYIGGIFFFVGLLFLLISWHFTYPISMPDFDDIIFSQFHPMIWPGILFSLMGLFVTGYFTTRKSVRVICASLFPIVLYAYVFYFSYVPTSDSGGVKAMFEVFHHTGINSAVESYFHYPIFFTLNEMTSQLLGLTASGLAALFFALFGILIACYLYLFIFKITEHGIYHIAFLAVPIYFIAIFTYLNYQWVPQTLALILFLLLLLFFDQKKTAYKFLSILIFTVLVFTHLFIPAIYLLFLGIYAIKKKEFRNSFLLMGCLYSTVLIYYTTFFLPIIIDAFTQTIYGFGEEYTINISRSFMEPQGFVNQLISLTNRVRIPLTWVVLSTGFLILFVKRKINFPAIALGVTGGVYFGIGMFYSILGTRALQILFIPLVLGIGFFMSKWKKPTLLFVAIIVMLSIFGPIRSSYDDHLYQVSEEEYACNFLAHTMPVEQPAKLAIGGINAGYFLKKFTFMHMYEKDDLQVWVLVPRNEEFYMYFNDSLEEDEYVLYNPNLGKELVSYGLERDDVQSFSNGILKHNKIYQCQKTIVIAGT